MKWYLVNRFDEIVDTCEIASGVGVSGAKTYFRKRKQMKVEDFDKLWKVMSKEKWDLRFKATLQNRQVEWWKEDKDIVDDELKL
tara:strand:- start:292 stop:543 length:252 start_codon:yes stop_codon:yes gene_type:complete